MWCSGIRSDVKASSHHAVREAQHSQMHQIICRESEQTATTSTGLDVQHRTKRPWTHHQVTNGTWKSGSYNHRPALVSHCQARKPQQTGTNTLTHSHIPGPKMRWTFAIRFVKAHAEGRMSWASKGRLKGACVYTTKQLRCATLGLWMHAPVT